MLWSGKNDFPECTFSPPPETWYHVCKKNNSVFMVTNDLALGVTFRFEAAGQHLNSERKSEEECPKLEPEPDRTGNNVPQATIPCFSPNSAREGQGGQSDLNATPLLALPSTAACQAPSNSYNRDCNGDSSV
ncbi:hypothetical protein SKAU_G00289140 [Synaphobranchus kaupii]|uniref:Uncharacterized protein n=1 Tax=Synaphobranchus kaupii TaxID=118154 RepID=A0A9Q1ETD1_SYNKA|nr:hypothetical protein SKAU_G00289140 [Synaphobranchus kaupii]